MLQWRALKKVKIQNSQSGFSLVEILIVIAIIALMGLVAVASISNIFRFSLNNSTRELASNIRSSANSSLITGRVYRLVYDLDEQQYWVEAGPPDFLLTAEDQERDRRIRNDNKQEEKPTLFRLDRSINRSKNDLPGGVRFIDVSTQQFREPITDGLAYTHFFPHGLTEQTLIRMEDDQGNEVSLTISALLGKTRVITGHVERNEIFRN
jgi:prepilin-type N-terminal cleavage/methylation domain-containing protein